LSDNRDPPKNEQDRRDSTTAEVVLAFPLTSDYKPLNSNQRQELFAFLPLRSSDYKVSSKIIYSWPLRDSYQQLSSSTSIQTLTQTPIDKTSSLHRGEI
jgi:hypothetical protein